ncbi:hypothetical protein R70006_06284 [Paraburkholderia domus]|uniref:hypothetical protein n=1 Tax=Paraburkholderia domus TaxID=2793075 RepID=UPI0019117D84|nr:hypothetical protein [Paraburkholderia domus]MBK5052915.1 hypothetical protein [Burkholderia sp. R-70006]CAE6822771.1 hypothetical protein R70006_06284 [Paraburkholderia domus]
MNNPARAVSPIEHITPEEIITSLAILGEDPTVERAMEVLAQLDTSAIAAAPDRAAAIREAIQRPAAAEVAPRVPEGMTNPFMFMRGRMAVINWTNGDPLPDFSGVAYDPGAKKFVLTEIANGERTMTHLLSSTHEAAEREADALRPTLASADKVFADLGNRSVIDVIRENGRGFYSGKNYEETLQQYPDALLLTLDQAYQHIENSLIDPVAKEIDRTDFVSGFEVLPPNRWHHGRETESFMSSEHYSGQITRVYARIEDKYYSFLDRCTLKHDEIIGKVKASIAELAKATPALESPAPEL